MQYHLPFLPLEQWHRPRAVVDGGQVVPALPPLSGARHHDRHHPRIRTIAPDSPAQRGNLMPGSLSLAGRRHDVTCEGDVRWWKRGVTRTRDGEVYGQLWHPFLTPLSTPSAGRRAKGFRPKWKMSVVGHLPVWGHNRGEIFVFVFWGRRV